MPEVNNKTQIDTSMKWSNPLPTVLIERSKVATLDSEMRLALIRLALSKNRQTAATAIYNLGIASAFQGKSVPVGFLMVLTEFHDNVAADTLAILEIFHKLGIITQLNDKTGRMMFDKSLWTQEDENQRTTLGLTICDEQLEKNLDEQYLVSKDLQDVYKAVFLHQYPSSADTTMKADVTLRRA